MLTVEVRCSKLARAHTIKVLVGDDILWQYMGSRPGIHEMDPALRSGLVGIGGRDDLLIQVKLAGVRECALFLHGFRTWEDLVV